MIELFLVTNSALADAILALAWVFGVCSARENFSVSNLLMEKSFSLEKLLAVRSSTVENDFATKFFSTGVTSAPANFLSCAELTSVMSGRKSRSASFLSCSCAPTGKGKLVRQRRRKIQRTPASLPQALRACKGKAWPRRFLNTDSGGRPIFQRPAAARCSRL